jgi:hypothetical protein
VNTHPMSKVTCDVCGWTRSGYFGVAEAKCPMDSAPGKEIGDLYVTWREAHRKYNEEVANCLGQIKDKYRAGDSLKIREPAKFHEPTFEDNLLKSKALIQRMCLEIILGIDEAKKEREENEFFTPEDAKDARKMYSTWRRGIADKKKEEENEEIYRNCRSYWIQKISRDLGEAKRNGPSDDWIGWLAVQEIIKKYSA